MFATHPPQTAGSEGYQGYHYRILTGAGPVSPGGAYTYIVGGRMRNGFAAIAWPAQYGETGVMSFMISHDGVVFEKDLGKDGAAVAEAMKTFDPGRQLARGRRRRAEGQLNPGYPLPLAGEEGVRDLLR